MFGFMKRLDEKAQLPSSPPLPHGWGEHPYPLPFIKLPHGWSVDGYAPGGQTSDRWRLICDGIVVADFQEPYGVISTEGLDIFATDEEARKVVLKMLGMVEQQNKQHKQNEENEKKRLLEDQAKKVDAAILRFAPAPMPPARAPVRGAPEPVPPPHVLAALDRLKPALDELVPIIPEPKK